MKGFLTLDDNADHFLRGPKYKEYCRHQSWTGASISIVPRGMYNLTDRIQELEQYEDTDGRHVEIGLNRT